uniref:Uncharacterized protein n=1 Tax=Branchiostoma floridae TaxID=7739 RepID=C3ZD08_BRAFL|eukprot:XP_002593508.1 hypothetical protein BRAFLDRAFT_101843 [Branchiostoma floridae]
MAGASSAPLPPPVQGHEAAWRAVRAAAPLRSHSAVSVDVRSRSRRISRQLYSHAKRELARGLAAIGRAETVLSSGGGSRGLVMRPSRPAGPCGPWVLSGATGPCHRHHVPLLSAQYRPVIWVVGRPCG